MAMAISEVRYVVGSRFTPRRAAALAGFLRPGRRPLFHAESPHFVVRTPFTNHVASDPRKQDGLWVLPPRRGRDDRAACRRAGCVADACGTPRKPWISGRFRALMVIATA